jgi:ferritin
MKKIIKFRLFEGIEDDSRLSEDVAKILNKQIRNELQSSQIYRGMSCWCDDKGWIDASKYFFKSAQEELTHQDKIYEYLFSKNVLAEVPVTEEVKQDFDDIRDVIETSLEHEIDITSNWDKIAELAKEEGDNTTYEFSQWFLKEQTEEEEKFRNMLFKINLDMPKYEIDDMFRDLLK